MKGPLFVFLFGLSAYAVTSHVLGFAVSITLFFVVLFTLGFVFRAQLSYVLPRVLYSGLNIFFRTIETRGTHNVPLDGPVMFVCGPHANQFVDPLLVMGSISRRIRFISAAKSCRRAVVGLVIKLLNSIPVERSQDVATSGTGTVTIDGARVKGSGTRFLDEFSEKGVSIGISGEAVKVDEIISDTEMTLKEEFPEPVTEMSTFKVYPKVDHHQMFSKVYDCLGNGEAVGIFPEGGSHDQTHLLELKVGVALMVLGYLSNLSKHDESKEVKIVPVGLTYFHGHRFRGRALVAFGDPIEVPAELVEQYRAGGTEKRIATKELMKIIEAGLLDVTVSASDYETMKLLWAARRLYKPDHVRLSLLQTAKLTQAFANGYSQLEGHPAIAMLRTRVEVYNSALSLFGIRDHQVNTSNLNRPIVMKLLAVRMTLLIVLVIVIVPVFLLALPVLLPARIFAYRKAAEAVAHSNVKIAGRDVLATWKLLACLILIPSCWVIYTLIAAYLYGQDIAVAVFWLMVPIVWVSLYLMDTLRRVANSITPLTVSLFKPKIPEYLKNMRDGLKKDIRQFVSDHHEELGLKGRMFLPDDFEDKEQQPNLIPARRSVAQLSEQHNNEWISPTDEAKPESSRPNSRSSSRPSSRSGSRRRLPIPPKAAS